MCSYVEIDFIFIKKLLIGLQNFFVFEALRVLEVGAINRIV